MSRTIREIVEGELVPELYEGQERLVQELEAREAERDVWTRGRPEEDDEAIAYVIAKLRELTRERDEARQDRDRYKQCMDNSADLLNPMADALAEAKALGHDMAMAELGNWSREARLRRARVWRSRFPSDAFPTE